MINRGYGFATREHAVRVGEATRYVEGMIKSSEPTPNPRRKVPHGTSVRGGKLNGTLARNGSADATWWTVSDTGGLSAATEYTMTVIDIGQIPAAVSPLPSNTVVTVAKVGGVWILIAYDCDAV